MDAAKAGMRYSPRLLLSNPINSFNEPRKKRRCLSLDLDGIGEIRGQHKPSRLPGPVYTPKP
jgi:hypothetical protein